MKKIKATYIGKPDNRWGFVPEQIYTLNVYARGNERVWAGIADAPMTQPPASWPDIMDFFTNWTNIDTFHV